MNGAGFFSHTLRKGSSSRTTRGEEPAPASTSALNEEVVHLPSVSEFPCFQMQMHGRLRAAPDLMIEGLLATLEKKMPQEYLWVLQRATEVEAGMDLLPPLPNQIRRDRDGHRLPSSPSFKLF